MSLERAGRTEKGKETHMHANAVPYSTAVECVSICRCTASSKAHRYIYSNDRTAARHYELFDDWLYELSIMVSR